MTFDRRKKIMVAIAVVIALLLAIALWWFWLRSPASVSNEPTTNTPSSQLPTSPIVQSPTATPPLTEGEQDSVRLARLFTERFGTFTSQSQFEGVREITPLATASFATWLTTNYLPGLRAKYPAGTYAGQTTRVMSTAVIASTDTTAEILVRTQRESTAENQESVVTYPTLTVSLLKTDDGWFVDSAFWEGA